MLLKERMQPARVRSTAEPVRDARTEEQIRRKSLEQAAANWRDDMRSAYGGPGGHTEDAIRGRTALRELGMRAFRHLRASAVTAMPDLDVHLPALARSPPAPRVSNAAARAQAVSSAAAAPRGVADRAGPAGVHGTAWLQRPTDRQTSLIRDTENVLWVLPSAQTSAEDSRPNLDEACKAYAQMLRFPGVSDDLRRTIIERLAIALHWWKKTREEHWAQVPRVSREERRRARSRRTRLHRPPSPRTLRMDRERAARTMRLDRLNASRAPRDAENRGDGIYLQARRRRIQSVRRASSAAPTEVDTESDRAPSAAPSSNGTAPTVPGDPEFAEHVRGSPARAPSDGQRPRSSESRRRPSRSQRSERRHHG